MNKKILIRFLSVFMSLLLLLSVPLCAYADADDAAAADSEIFAESENEQQDLSYEELEEKIADGTALLLEGEDDSDEIYLVEIEETEEDNDPDLTEEPEEESAVPDPEEESEEDALPAVESEEDSLPEEETAGEDEFVLTEESSDSEEADEEMILQPEDDPFAVAEEDSVDSADANVSVYYSGYCGANARWEITYNWDTSKWGLVISGTGAMYSYSYSYNESAGRYLTTAPWRDYYYYPDKITIAKGITSIGSYAFYGMTSPTAVSIGSTVTSIGSYAFYNNPSLNSVRLLTTLNSLGTSSLYSFSTIYYTGTSSQWYSIGGSNSKSSYATVYYTTHLKNTTVSLAKTKYPYTGKAIKPAVTVRYNYSTLTRGTDYKVTYKNNKKRGTATVIVQGLNRYHGTVRKTFKIVKRSINKAKVTGVKNKAYTGKAVKLSLKVKVKVGSKYVTLKQGRDFSVKYANNKKLSTSKSKARVTIKGKGNYAGTIKKTFKIVKKSPKLKFTKSKLTKTSKTGFTFKARKASSKLTLTYKSSNPKVATVNKKTGKVTPKKTGKTKITVTSKATKYYKAGKASYTLNIRPFRFKELNFWFSNYSAPYIPESTFRIFFGSVEASTYYNYYYSSGTNGVCFGMSASSMMFNTSGSGLSRKNFSSSASRLYDLYKSDTYKSSGLTLETMIEGMFVSQFGDKAQNVISRNKNKYGSLITNVRTGKPAMICIWSGYGGGHAIVGYKTKNVGSTTRVYVYDCNHPTDSDRYITFYRSGSRYTGWSYDMGGETWSSSAGRISYIPATSYRSIWKNRKGRSALSKMIVSSDNFEIYNANGELAASMTDGVFSSGSDEIYMMETTGDQPNAHLVYVPLGAYTILNTSPDTVGLNVTALNVEQSITVSTQSNTVLMDVNDDKAVNKAVFTPEKGEAYEVSLMSELPSAEGMEEISFSGVGTGSEITLGTENGSCIIDNAQDVSLEVNGEEVAYVVFDGEAVIDE